MNEWSQGHKYEFAFHNQLPRVFEVVNAIIAVEPGTANTQPGKESVSTKASIHAAALAIQKL